MGISNISVWCGGVNVVGESGANSHTAAAAAADREGAEFAVTRVSLLRTRSGDTDAGVGLSVENGG